MTTNQLNNNNVFQTLTLISKLHKINAKWYLDYVEYVFNGGIYWDSSEQLFLEMYVFFCEYKDKGEPV
ncbi:hypothetical protein CJD38_18290 [Stenotrophobium rhamnosiphilum]|uniref:Uncharacterized protein n=1 Tax=Stenotrophobium rhamnosiphilum TaxID=2029166 RepID=A0A2T5MAX9_9GAMM|nr:hypothetical protein CJD38_18290 [Stenotrophobium rhamnosiphilum]